MKPANPRILTINGGSSSIKFALFEAGDCAPKDSGWPDRADWIAGGHLAGEGRKSGGQLFAVSGGTGSHGGGGRSNGLDRGTQRT